MDLMATRFGSSESICSFSRQTLYLLCTLIYTTLQTFYIQKHLYTLHEW